MRLSIWASVPLFTVLSVALVIPSSNTHNDAVAGTTAVNTTEKAETLNALELEYQKLETLKHHLFELHHEVIKQEHQILAIINADFKSCSGVSCYLQTALKKAPDFFELVKNHFRRPKNGTASMWECPWSTGITEADGTSPTANITGETDTSTETETLATPGHKSTFPDDDIKTPFTPPPPPPSQFDGPFEFEPPFPPPGGDPSHFFRPEDDFTGPPPPPPGPPGYRPWKPNPNAPAAHPHHHQGPKAFSMPHPAPRHRHYRLILATAGGVVSALILLILFKALRLYLANPRVRADRAARREERRTQHEYRRAACQYRVRQVLSRLRGRRRRNSGTGDYEEKRAMIQRANSFDAADHIMGADINSLRRAHDIVGRLMRAEEGRVHSGHRSRGSSLSEPGASCTRSHTTVTTLPPYAPPPPRYSQELSRDMEVVDGFRYTPSQSEATITSSASSFVLDDADLATESSVVDCRSRMSMDTDSIVPSQSGDLANGRNRKSLELAGDRFRGQFD